MRALPRPIRGFDRAVGRSLDALYADLPAGEAVIVTESMLGDLPAPVGRYLRYTGVIGKPMVRTVRLRQVGKMRPGAGQRWMPLDAQQHYCVNPPGFVWSGRIHLGPMTIGRARDSYLHGRGRMLVRIASLVTVVDGRGAEMDQGSMMRYLSEMMFFPSAYLGANISFEAVDDFSARVTLTDHDATATGTMHFDPVGRLTDFVAKRYQAADGESALEVWSTPVLAYGELAGLRLPVRGGAVWKLAGGDLEYIDVAITELEFDPPVP